MGAIVKLSSKNQIVVPKEARKKLNLRSGDELMIEVEKGKVVMTRRPESYSKYMLGLGKKVWRGVEPTKYVKKERKSWQK